MHIEQNEMFHVDKDFIEFQKCKIDAKEFLIELSKRIDSCDNESERGRATILGMVWRMADCSSRICRMAELAKIEQALGYDLRTFEGNMLNGVLPCRK